MRPPMAFRGVVQRVGALRITGRGQKVHGDVLGEERKKRCLRQQSWGWRALRGKPEEKEKLKGCLGRVPWAGEEDK